MIRRPPRSTLSSSSAASDVYKRQAYNCIFNIADKSEAPRVVIHAIMGTVLLGLFMVKIAISRGLRRFYKRLPVLGAVLFVAITVLWVTSAGWYYFAQDA